MSWRFPGGFWRFPGGFLAVYCCLGWSLCFVFDAQNPLSRTPIRCQKLWFSIVLVCLLTEVIPDKGGWRLPGGFLAVSWRFPGGSLAVSGRLLAVSGRLLAVMAFWSRGGAKSKESNCCALSLPLSLFHRSLSVAMLASVWLVGKRVSPFKGRCPFRPLDGRHLSKGDAQKGTRNTLYIRCQSTP